MSYDAYKERRVCPYCSYNRCQADWVDIGIGLVQCAPFYCEECGACEIGPYDKPTNLTEQEKKLHWYEPGRSHLTSAPTLDGVPVDQKMAKFLYRIGLLDKKDDDDGEV